MVIIKVICTCALVDLMNGIRLPVTYFTLYKPKLKYLYHNAIRNFVR